MSRLSHHALLRLSDSTAGLVDTNLDLRGKHVIDSHNEDVGDVIDLLVDDTETRVRFLLIATGTPAGAVRREILVPVDAVNRVGLGRIVIDRTREHVTASPTYDPKA